MTNKCNHNQEIQAPLISVINYILLFESPKGNDAWVLM